MKQFEATGRYYVAYYAVSIFGGYPMFDIAGPDGVKIVTVIGDTTPTEPGGKTTTRERMQAPADRLVEILNRTLP